MAEKIPLTVVILTKNETDRIRDCIESVRGWADDILVVDDESTDDTVAIAESLGARALRRKMEIEGRHRNWAQDQAKHEWVLSLDADERVTPELAQEIAAAIRSGTMETYSIPRRNFIGEHWIRHGGWYPSGQLKLFKKSVFRWEEASVHPRAFGPAWGNMRHDILHYSYRDLKDFIRKQERHTMLEAQKWIADGRNVKLGSTVRRTIDRFLRTYLLKRGFLDGWTGLVIAWMAGKYQWASYKKYLRMKNESPMTKFQAPNNHP